MNNKRYSIWNHNSRLNRRPQKRRSPLALFLVADVVAAALLLGVFYVTNYLMQPEVRPVDLPKPSVLSAHPDTTAHTAPADTGSTVSAAASDTAIQTATTSPADPNDWRAKFAGKFTNGAVEKTESSYRSANINITIKEVRKYDITCYVADIYVAELKYFRTAFAKNPEIMKNKELTDQVADENGAIIAINGDHCLENLGTVVRNGKMYREPKSSADVFVMNYDGSMQAFSPDEFDIMKINSEGAYQVWTFGPMLLQNGQPMTKFNSTVTRLNPRTAVGYFEPGHYCFVQAGGRLENHSEGLTMQQLSQLMADLGCTAAYNLDGGQSAEMIFLGKMLNRQASRRSTPDILYIADN